MVDTFDWLWIEGDSYKCLNLDSKFFSHLSEQLRCKLRTTINYELGRSTQLEIQPDINA